MSEEEKKAYYRKKHSDEAERRKQTVQSEKEVNQLQNLFANSPKYAKFKSKPTCKSESSWACSS